GHLVVARRGEQPGDGGAYFTSADHDDTFHTPSGRTSERYVCHTIYRAEYDQRRGHHDELFWRKVGKAQDGSATLPMKVHSPLFLLLEVLGNAAICAYFGTIAKRPRIGSRFSFYAFLTEPHYQVERNIT